MSVQQIIKNSNYNLDLFSSAEIAAFEESMITKETGGKIAFYVKCLIRERDIRLKPEEVVRQLYLKRLLEDYGYPKARIAVEYPVKFGSETRFADIVIRDKDHPDSAYAIVELKKPKQKEGKDQLKSYCHATGSPIGVWTNGGQIFYWHRINPNYFEPINALPLVTQTLADVLSERFTIEELIEKDSLREDKRSLKDIVLDMEDEVLANAGVDVFEEVFKLVFTKLYDEYEGARNPKRLLEFRNTGQTEAELKEKIQKLFDRAKEKWAGVFSEDAKIALTRSHLSICISSLQNVKLFNSNLDVIDEAFEYLVNKSSKGEKGQYFTPRYVIDMCVKMLNPQEDEYLIDTAAGSAGFTVHSIFKVWRDILADENLPVSHLFTAEQKPPRCADYVRDRVFAIDFDEKSERVARTLNLIAGDGQTNVLHLNSLDYDRWDDVTKEEDWQDTYHEGFRRLKKLRRERNSDKEFKFDVLMANPPFAGDIKETRIIHQYALGQKMERRAGEGAQKLSVGKGWHEKISRDILFVERNLDFLKPGGRMAIVLPQGRFNNSSDRFLREYIAEHCRILAVIGLHANTFKPHTGTKTSVLLVQKWNDGTESAGGGGGRHYARALTTTTSFSPRSASRARTTPATRSS